MRRNRNECVISNFVCSNCNTVIPLPRNHGRQRKRGHIKDLYCPACDKITKCKEFTYQDFYMNMDGEILNQ